MSSIKQRVKNLEDKLENNDEISLGFFMLLSRGQDAIDFLMSGKIGETCLNDSQDRAIRNGVHPSEIKLTHDQKAEISKIFKNKYPSLY